MDNVSIEVIVGSVVFLALIVSVLVRCVRGDSDD